MKQTILFKVPGKPSTRPLVILTGPAVGIQYSTPLRVRLSRALSQAGQWVRCNCAPRQIARFLFSVKASATGRLALSLGLILLCALGALYCFARAGQTDAALWKLAALGCWLPALPAIFSGKGGAQ